MHIREPETMAFQLICDAVFVRKENYQLVFSLGLLYSRYIFLYDSNLDKAAEMCELNP